MKTIFGVVIIVFVAFGCSKNEGDASGHLVQNIGYKNVPHCMQIMIEDEEYLSSNTFIKRQTIDNSIHYWLNTGANARDGDELIVNSECETVCKYAGWIPEDCIKNYVFEDWEIIWP